MPSPESLERSPASPISPCSAGAFGTFKRLPGWPRARMTSSGGRSPVGMRGYSLTIRATSSGDKSRLGCVADWTFGLSLGAKPGSVSPDAGYSLPSTVIVRGPPSLGAKPGSGKSRRTSMLPVSLPTICLAPSYKETTMSLRISVLKDTAWPRLFIRKPRLSFCCSAASVDTLGAVRLLVHGLWTYPRQLFRWAVRSRFPAVLRFSSEARLDSRPDCPIQMVDWHSNPHDTSNILAVEGHNKLRPARADARLCFDGLSRGN